ncbi:MAG TPA: MFS transporter [Chloroflexota bacterium]
MARARISGLITATYTSASVIGPLAGGYLTDTLSWRWVFYLNVPFGLLALVLLWRTFPRAAPPSATRPPMDLGGALTVTLATTALLLAVGRGGSGPAEVVLLASAGALGVGFVVIEKRAVDPIVPLRLFKSNTIALSAYGSLALSVGIFGASLFIPLYMQGVLGTSATLSGSLMAPLAITILLTNLANGFLLAHFGKYRVFALAGFASGTAGFLALSLLQTESPYLQLVLSMVLLGTGSGLVISTLALAAQNAASYADLGVVTSLVQFSRSLGSTLGSAVLGSILVWQLMPQPNVAPPPAALADALRWVFGCAAVVMASGFVAGLLLHDVPFRRRHQPATITDSRPATTDDADGHHSQPAHAPHQVRGAVPPRPPANPEGTSAE